MNSDSYSNNKTLKTTTKTLKFVFSKTLKQQQQQQPDPRNIW